MLFAHSTGTKLPVLVHWLSNTAGYYIQKVIIITKK